jgi:hypothetical protein
MPDLYRYSESFDPVLLEGMTATLYSSHLPEGGLPCKCLAIQALPEYYKDFGALTAGVWDENNTDTDLELNEMEFGQFRMRVVDDMKCRLKNPSAFRLWTTKNSYFYLPRFPIEGDEGSGFLRRFLWRASEFFVWEDNPPLFDFYSFAALTASRVLFSGWKFKVGKVTPTLVKGPVIYLDNWPSGGTLARP